MKKGRTLNKSAQISDILKDISRLSPGQLNWIRKIVIQFLQPMENWRNAESDLISACVLENFGDILRIHHSFSREAFSKDKFEYALENAYRLCNSGAELAARGNRGFDITINNQRFSLKTQADKNIKEGYIHISKFMELGGGQWTDQKSDLVGLRKQFFANTEGYERILSLRCLTPQRKNPWQYELVEIPKALLLESSNGQFRVVSNSSQNPKPGYCEVFESDKKLKFRLYFDGGGERKLQIQKINKSLCTVHARWSFSVGDLEKRLVPKS
jgi:hypothetical protein